MGVSVAVLVMLNDSGFVGRDRVLRREPIRELLTLVSVPLKYATLQNVTFY